MADAPVATRALLLTDVVQSTQLTERLGDAAMSALWARHDRAARDLLVAHNGREIDKSDGFLLLFDHAVDAVAYALAYHAALRPLELRARAGLHVAPVHLRTTHAADVARGAKPVEVDGLAKSVAARIMGVAVGGQTLLSAEARAALGATGLRVASHGHWRVKGVAEPLELFEVGDADAAIAPPPDGDKAYRVLRSGDAWVPVKDVPRSLPAERDAFVGRADDLRALSRLLDDGARLITVLGIGGAGKTRLVTRFAWTWLGDFPGGAWFCDLSEARDLDGVVLAAARALDVSLGADDAVARVGSAIARRGRCLVILDNFEQVARHAPRTVGRWLDRAPEAAFVVTTRELLGLQGETALALSPMGSGEAAALFAARAAQARRDFALGDEDGAHVAALVGLLDHLPLAIELAAARVRTMSPATILARMAERFRLLASAGGRPARHATLRGVLDWSWDLLGPDEQRALAQLSVFEGGFDLAAAEAVLSLAEAWPADAVQALADRSLVRRLDGDRFDLLMTVQAYAAERLEASGERAAAEARHGAHFARSGTPQALAALAGHGGLALRRALARERSNLVAACRRAVARGDGEVAATTLRAAWSVALLRGPFAVVGELAAEVVGIAALRPAARCGALRVSGLALQRMGRHAEAQAALQAALALVRASHEPALEGEVLDNLALQHLTLGRPDEACAAYEASLAISRALGDRLAEGVALGNLGYAEFVRGRLDEAHAAYVAALEVNRQTGNRKSEAYGHANLGELLAARGLAPEAEAHLDAARSIAREVGDDRVEGAVLGHLAELKTAQRRWGEARADLDAGEALLRGVGDGEWLGGLLCRRARLEHADGHPEAARARLREAESLAGVAEAPEDSVLGKALARTRAALAGGHPLR